VSDDWDGESFVGYCDVCGGPGWVERVGPEGDQYEVCSDTCKEVLLKDPDLWEGSDCE
jgi:hypothetical protein